MKDVFIITDYDEGKIMYVFLTDNAGGCEEALGDIDALTDYDDYEDDETKKLLADIKYNDNWVSAFRHLCKLRNIELEDVRNIGFYRY